MDTILNFIQKCFIFEKEPQRIGLSQFKDPVEQPKKEQPATQASKPQQNAEKPINEQRKKDRTNVRVVDTCFISSC